MIGCVLLIAVGMQPPYDRAATIVAGSLVVLAAAWFGSDAAALRDRLTSAKILARPQPGLCSGSMYGKMPLLNTIRKPRGSINGGE